MRKSWFPLVPALIGAALACDLVSVSSSPEPSQVLSVAVTPTSGSGSFTLEVVTSASPISDDRFVDALAISCYYVTPGGTAMAIGSVFPPGEGGPRTDTLTFNVSEPGDYTATCKNKNSTSKKSAQFTVSDYPTATSTATGTPTTTPTATLELSALKGKIIFDYSNYQSSRPSESWELDWGTKWCIPEVTITLDGVVSGTCEYSGGSHTSQSTTIAHITGIAVQGGSFNFTYVVTEQGATGFSVDAMWKISYTGSGNFTSATQASGTAIFDFSCNTGSDQLHWCNLQTTYESFSGTIPWSFVASP